MLETLFDTTTLCEVTRSRNSENLIFFDAMLTHFQTGARGVRRKSRKSYIAFYII